MAQSNSSDLSGIGLAIFIGGTLPALLIFGEVAGAIVAVIGVIILVVGTASKP